MRGYQKKVIFIKNVGGEIFEEAYFVIKGEEKTLKISHTTMVAEAKRIIEENFGTPQRRLRLLKCKTLFAFFAGFILSFVLTVAFF